MYAWGGGRRGGGAGRGRAGRAGRGGAGRVFDSLSLVSARLTCPKRNSKKVWRRAPMQTSRFPQGRLSLWAKHRSFSQPAGVVLVAAGPELRETSSFEVKRAPPTLLADVFTVPPQFCCPCLVDQFSQVPAALRTLEKTGYTQQGCKRP